VDERGAFPEPGADLEYDLAHEASAAQTSPGHGDEEPRQAVVTATPAYDGDYSYDMAHDIPEG
jgi:hypothetical protein